VRVVIGTRPSGQGHETSFATGDLVIAVGAAARDRHRDGRHRTWSPPAGARIPAARCGTPPTSVLTRPAPELIAKGKRLAAVLLGRARKRGRVRGRAASPRRAATAAFGLIELARGPLPPETARELRVTAEHEMHDPVFPTVAPSARSRSTRRPAPPTSSRYSVVDDCRPLHQSDDRARPDAWRRRAGDRPGDVGACVVDPGSGQPLAGTFMDYGMPRADTLPSFRTEIVEVLSPRNPMGIKAGGEGGTTPAPAVIVTPSSTP
jgi:carbon-monoxide dehydrogenase large subunit